MFCSQADSLIVNIFLNFHISIFNPKGTKVCLTTIYPLCYGISKMYIRTLRVYGVGGQLLERIRFFYENASASVRVNGELSESFNIEVGVRQGCLMSPWLFNIYMDGCIRKMKVRVRDLGARLNVRGVEQPLVAGLYADDTVLLIETEGMLQRIVDEFDRI